MAAARARAGLATLIAALTLAGAAAPAGTFTRGTLEGRLYRVWVPPRPASGSPLVVGLHGCWQTPEDFALGSRLNEAAERRGLVVVYPAQSRRENPYRCWNWFEPAQQTAAGRETRQILAIARRVQAERGLGEGRLLAIGFSAGAFMAVNLACAAPDAVAGIGSLAGGPFRCADGPEAAIQCLRGQFRDGAAAATACAGGRGRNWRVSLWHGALDAVVSPANLTVLETMFARLLRVDAGATTTEKGIVRAVYRDARGAPVLETWLVRGMGHAWSGGDPGGTYTWAPGPSATERMLDFLLGAP
ncbi:MAG TPA: PHB depolymerase family esterase [Methylomirabilota bacterium]|nr:PHB depolymerase family esterase [Methylomirabilota bacterium]